MTLTCIDSLITYNPLSKSMAEDTQTEEEPSIEEILDSIRQIISEDDDEEGEEAIDTPEPAKEPEEETAPNVPLDQSAVDEIDFDAPEPEVTPEPEPEPTPEPEPEPEPEVTPEPEPEDDVLELVDRVDETDQMDVDLRDEEVSEPQPAPEPVEESDIFTSKAETAAVGAITQLVKKTAVERGGVTLEEIVRSELKPMLRDWLDNNLPSLIERLVSEELERVSNRLLED